MVLRCALSPMAEHHSLLGGDKPTRGILSRAKKSVNYLPRLGGEPNSKLIVSFLRVWRGAEGAGGARDYAHP